MPKKLIIGISAALVLIVRSRSLVEEVPIDGGTTTEGGTSTGGLGGTTTVPGGSQGGQGTTTTPTTTPQAGPCGDGVCSEGESPWCKPDCGDKEERFLGSIKGTVSGTTITIAWAT